MTATTSFLAGVSLAVVLLAAAELSAAILTHRRRGSPPADIDAGGLEQGRPR